MILKLLKPGSFFCLIPVQLFVGHELTNDNYCRYDEFCQNIGKPKRVWLWYPNNVHGDESACSAKDGSKCDQKYQCILPLDVDARPQRYDATRHVYPSHKSVKIIQPWSCIGFAQIHLHSSTG